MRTVHTHDGDPHHVLAHEVDSLITDLGLDPTALRIQPEDAGATMPHPPVAVPADAGIDPEVHAAEIALVEAHARARMAAEIERVKAQAATQREAELAARDAAARAERERAVADARAQAESAARETIVAELGRTRAEAEQQLARELQRAREESERHLRERLAEVQEAAARAVDAELARVRAESGLNLQDELASLRDQLEVTRRAHAAAQQNADQARQQAARDVQAAAQNAAARAFELEAVRVRAEAERRIQQESERVRQEAQQRLDAELTRLHAGALAQAAVGPDGRPATDRIQTPDHVLAVSASEHHGSPMRTFWAAAAAAAAITVGAGGYLLLPGIWAATPDAPVAASAAPPVAAPVSGSKKKAPARPAVRPAKAAAAAAPTPAPAPVPAAGDTAPAGVLMVYSRVPLDLIENGRRIGSTEDGQLTVPSGRRRFELANARLNYRGEITLDIPAGRVAAHTVTLPPGQLHVTGTPGAELWVEGTHVGTLPMDAVPVPIGTREVVVRHPVFGERRHAVEVVYGATTELALPQGDAAGLTATK